ncbi:MAG: hypothetical protein O3A00_29125 [Planctomycetota bacterium]|nr:hypothetical protein [Planctomycetota bacterium]
MFLQLQGEDAEVVDALKRGDLDGAKVDAAHCELLLFSRVLTESPAATTDNDTQRLRDVGWNDSQIAEAVYVVALFAFFNRVADAFGIQAEDFGPNGPRPKRGES